MQRLFVVFLSLTLSGAYCALAPFIKPCKSNDSECIKQSAQAAVSYIAPGIPELGVPPSDPLTLKEINADQGDLKLTFKDFKIEGLGQSRIESLTRDENNSVFTITMVYPLQINGHYKLDGKIFIIPAQGDGKFEIKSDGIKLIAHLKYKTITDKNGAEHWKITSYEYSYDLIKKVHFQLENLFGGDESRAKPVLEIFDNSWKEIVTELGGPIIEALVKEVVKNLKKFFMAVPTSELELS